MTPPATRSAAEQVRQMFDLLTPTERRAAKTLLAHYPMLGLETVAQFAARAHVSGPTILRLVNKLGFSSYVDFQRQLRDELEARLQSPLATPPEATDRSRDFLPRFADAVCANVHDTLSGAVPGEFEALVEMLADRRRGLHVIGGRFSDGIARYVHARLSVLRPRVQHIGSQSAAWAEIVVDLGRRDVVLIFDLRRYQDDLAVLAERCVRQGAQVALFTDQWMSPVARHARWVFAAHTALPAGWDSSVAVLALAEALITALNDRDWPRVRTRMERLERLRSGR